MEDIDTVVIGNGPSAMILSFILEGNIPYYNTTRPHPDSILHNKLSKSPCLLDIDVNDLTAHFAASRLSYSTQALPVNVLLDTLLRPLNDTDPGKYESCVEWRFEEEKAVSHKVIGNASRAGGQWADNPVSASWDIGALSYAEMLSLPGYSFSDHEQAVHGKPPEDFHRPTRREVADYLAAYPIAIGIEKAIRTKTQVNNVSRIPGGFHIGSHNLTCRHLVLASGIFSNLIPPRPLLQPLAALPGSESASTAPLLVVGSGFTAADVILSTPPERKIIHIFKWDPEHQPSPLRACHPRAYPEYASVYRQMKSAAQSTLGINSITSPLRSRKSNPFFQDRDWANKYEGLPNTYIKHVTLHEESASLRLETWDGHMITRQISRMQYVIGRRGLLSYLEDDLSHEIGRSQDCISINQLQVSGDTLRSKVEKSLQLAPNVFAIGSLTGDSLIRFAFGGCVFAAREIMSSVQSPTSTVETSRTQSSESLSTTPDPSVGALSTSASEFFCPGQHSDVDLNRCMHPFQVDVEV